MYLVVAVMSLSAKCSLKSTPVFLRFFPSLRFFFLSATWLDIPFILRSRSRLLLCLVDGLDAVEGDAALPLALLCLGVCESGP